MTYDAVKDKLKCIFNDAGTSKGDLANVKTEDVYEFEETEQTPETTLYARNRGRGGRSSFHRGSRGRGRGQVSTRGKTPLRKTNDGKNPLDNDGNHTQCIICKSIFHWAPKCPHKDSDTDNVCEENCSLVTQELVMC